MVEPDTAEVPPDVTAASRVPVPIAVDRPGPAEVGEPGPGRAEDAAATGGVELRALSAFYGSSARSAR